jgi:hypothetical protein
MFSNLNYEKKYLKYKNKYLILKNQYSNILSGGECDPLPDEDEEDMMTMNNLRNLDPYERITIQNKCYEVRSLYRWIILQNKDKLPATQINITAEERQRLIEAYQAMAQG